MALLHPLWSRVVTDLIQFALNHSCPKCGEVAFHWVFIRAGFHIEHAGGMRCPAPDAEHLELTCQRCRYVLAMQTKDAT